MTVESGGFGRIKVTLTYEDSCQIGINFKDIDCKQAHTRLILRALFKAATQKLGQNLPANRLLIEAYPHINGGGILYFSAISTVPRKRLRVKKKPEYFAYDFNDGTNLLCAIERLYKNEPLKTSESRIYDVDGVFRLVINCEHNFDSDIKEFCDSATPYERVKKYTCEHGKVLTGDNAIIEIGSKLKCL